MIVEKPTIVYIAPKCIDVSRLLQITLIVIAANDCHLSRVVVYTSCRLRARICPCVRYIRVHVRILIPPRQLLACLLALVVAWLPYRILTHIHVHCHAAAHKLLARISPFQAPGALHRICRRDRRRYRAQLQLKPFELEPQLTSLSSRKII